MYERIDAPVAGPRAHYVVERDDGGADSRHTFRFTVVGAGPFPFDMLRYDDCYPADTDSAMNLQPTSVRREVVLVSHQPRRWWNPTFDRWRSFGWVVKTDVEG